MNTVTGVRYADDPTIFAWELMNESSAVLPDTAAARLDWIDEMSWYLKARDPSHLVAAGVWGYGTRGERAEWIRVHRLVGVDYCDSHLYPEQTDRVGSARRLLDLVDDRAQLARFVVGKPLVIGEFGFHTDRPRPFLGEPRAVWFRRLLQRLFRDGGSGALAWIYQPWTGKARDFGIYADRRSTNDVRGVLKGFAARLAAGRAEPANPRLSAAVGDRPLYDTAVTIVGRAAPHRRWRAYPSDAGALRLTIAPAGFAEARFERAGTWDGGTLAHFYGGGAGHVDYRFTSPASANVRAPTALGIAARISSEWPGSTAPADGGSTVEVRIDGAPVGTLRAIPDDGAGAVQELVVRDRGALRRLGKGTHRVTFAVAEAGDAHGLCIYGERTGGAATIAVEGDVIPVTLTWWKKGSGDVAVGRDE